MQKMQADTTFSRGHQSPHSYGISVQFAFQIGTQSGMTDDTDAYVMSNKHMYERTRITHQRPRDNQDLTLQLVAICVHKSHRSIMNQACFNIKSIEIHGLTNTYTFMEGFLTNIMTTAA